MVSPRSPSRSSATSCRRRAAMPSIRTRSLFASLGADGSGDAVRAVRCSHRQGQPLPRILRRREDRYHSSRRSSAVSLFDRLDFWERPGAAGPSMEVTGGSVCAAHPDRRAQPRDARAADLRRAERRRAADPPAPQGDPGAGGDGRRLERRGDGAARGEPALRLPGVAGDADRVGRRARLRHRLLPPRGTAFCTGRGELIEPLDPLPPAPSTS